MHVFKSLQNFVYRNYITVCAVKVAVALFIAAIVSFYVVAGSPVIGRLDTGITAWSVIHRTNVLTPIALFLTMVGSTISLIVLTVIAVATWLIRRRRVEALFQAAAIAASASICFIIKNIVKRARPPKVLRISSVEDPYSFPSGHTFNSTVFWGVLALLITFSTAHIVVKYISNIVSFALPLCIGWSRIYLAHHWFTDVAVGWLLGVTIVALAAIIYSRYSNHSNPLIVERSTDE